MFQFNYQKPKVIAEIGCNHMGDFAIAKELALLAKGCGANYAKFQKRNPKELLSEEQYNAPHPEPWQSYGDSYGKHREFLEFEIERHASLKKYCEEIGIGYSCSVWDVTSAEEIISLKPDFIKIPSACNTHSHLLKTLRDSFKGDVHVSVGMTTDEEIEKLISFFEEKNAAKNRLVVYSCTSGYPIKFKEVCMMEIKKLYEKYDSRIKEIGFSGHHLGIAIDVAAYTLGARWIERHFTKDRTWKGTDHAASLEMPGLQKLVRDLEHTYEALAYKPEEILPVENPQREKLKFKK
ncbi:MAG: N-acetylneuraminate synthase family protein [Chitinophagales bacterium]